MINNPVVFKEIKSSSEYQFVVEKRKETGE